MSDKQHGQIEDIPLDGPNCTELDEFQFVVRDLGIVGVGARCGRDTVAVGVICMIQLVWVFHQPTFGEDICLEISNGHRFE